VKQAVADSGFTITEVISGTAGGVDKLGERYAREHGIRLKCMSAEWDKYGKSAGYRRNEQMAEVADALIAVHNGSKGTGHMINIARRNGLKIHEVKI
jgi:hypothetical protein